MAVPANITTKNLNGTFVMNKQLSDSSTNTLKLQNVGMLVRQAANYSTITVQLKQYTDDKGVEHLDQTQTSTGGITSHEERYINGELLDAENNIWGKVQGKTRYAKVSELDDAFLKEGWSQDCLDGEVIVGWTQSKSNDWESTLVYGFAEINGERRHVRRVVTKKKGKEDKIKLVYDWKST
ncbi:hypothetical protein K470DRAFT_265820 [Piedraia hortae CBS 480.64]|uniref:Uncharacterized protein n=1 Tax=Piedraia hortae CBS 480.64 TaxID=1314780 RepID=A0A6A7BUH4_9PEZI|nr:hypothetical protein K470DRAFT_265820 [Piedraia hortae CBS 480.64]